MLNLRVRYVYIENHWKRIGGKEIVHDEWVILSLKSSLKREEYTIC